MKTKFLFFLLLLTCLAATTFAQKRKNKKPKYNYLTPTLTSNEIKALPNKIEKIYYMSLGHFTNKKQADTTQSPIYKEQEFICVPMWRKQRVGEYWAYFSWYQANNIETPLGQFVFKLAKKDRDTFAFEIYGLPEEMRGLGWEQEDPFNKFKPQDLIKTDCIYQVFATGENQFRIQLPTGASPCQSTAGMRSTTAYYSFETEIQLEKQISYSTFYDKDQKVMVTYKPIGNHFERIPKNQPKYLDILYPKKGK